MTAPEPNGKNAKENFSVRNQQGGKEGRVEGREKERYLEGGGRGEGRMREER